MKQLIIMVYPPATACAPILGHVFNCLPNVGFVGETSPLKDRQVGCIECAVRPPEDGCPVFVEGLAGSKTGSDWYGAFADAMHVDTMIAMEPNREAYGKVGLEPKGTKAIILYQNPLEWMAGSLRHYGLQHRVTPGDLLDLCSKWGSFYSDHMRWLEVEKIPFASFDLDRFGEYPEDSLEKLCWYYQMKHDKSALRWHDGDHHKVTGPWAVKSNPPSQDFVKTTKYLTTFSQSAIRAVVADDMVKTIYRSLAEKKINNG
jgi:hypothetical protein